MEAPQKRSPTILIVDDEPNNIVIIQNIVNEFDVHVLTASNGRECLQHLADNPVDMVLLDIMMPDMDGFETLKRIRETRAMDELPVIMLSSLDSTDDIVEALKLGANDYIPKLVSVRLMHIRIGNQLQLIKLSGERQHALQLAQTANETNIRLMRIASHDLKNPLHNMGMVLNMLEKEPLSAPELLPLANKSLDTMLSIINEFLDSGILRDGEFDVELQPVNVANVVYEVIKAFQQTANNKGVSILHDITPATVTADARRLEQVLSNLVSNAIKYTRPSTTVYIQGYIEARSYHIDVIDQGQGIDSQEADMLFKPFSQLSNEPTAGEHSTGLGLWIVQQMVKAQHGEVGVNLEVDDGANFWIRLPLST